MHVSDNKSNYCAKYINNIKERLRRVSQSFEKIQGGNPSYMGMCCYEGFGFQAV